MNCMLVCMLFIMPLSALDKKIEQKYPSDRKIKKIRINYSYFLMQAINEFFITSDVWKHQEKMKNIPLFCCRAHHKIDTQLLWALLIYVYDQKSLHEYKEHILRDTKEEFSVFIMQKYQELEIPCEICLKYSGYSFEDDIV
jgi:hypothetical protein